MSPECSSACARWLPRPSRRPHSPQPWQPGSGAVHKDWATTPTGGAVFFTNYAFVCSLASTLFWTSPLARWTRARGSLYVCGLVFPSTSLLEASSDRARNDKLAVSSCFESNANVPCSWLYSSQSPTYVWPFVSQIDEDREATLTFDASKGSCSLTYSFLRSALQGRLQPPSSWWIRAGTFSKERKRKGESLWYPMTERGIGATERGPIPESFTFPSLSPSPSCCFSSPGCYLQLLMP